MFGLKHEGRGLNALLCVLVAVLVVIPAWETPYFYSHLSRVWQGGLEALILIGACCTIVASGMQRSMRLGALCLVGLLFLRQQNTDLPFFTALVYFEAMVSIGSLVLLPWQGQRGGKGRWVLHALMGFTTSALVIMALSVFGFAYPLTSYLAILTLGLIAWLVVRARPLTMSALGACVDGRRPVRFVATTTLVVVLVVAAKSRMISDYDSLWYGLKTAYVLQQNGSIFTSMGLSTFVYYYPKVYETLLLPLSFTDITGYLGCFNACSLALLAGAVHQFILDCRVAKSVAMLGALVTVLTPVAVGTALVVKPDFFTALVLFVAFMYIARFAASHALDDACVVIAALALALAGKLTAIPFGGILFICLLGFTLTRLVHLRGEKVSAFSAPSGMGLWLVGLTATTWALFTYRTYEMTGVPYVEPRFLLDWATAVGMQPHFPFSPWDSNLDAWKFSWQGLLSVVDELFMPAGLPHIIMIWPGNIYAFLLVVSLVSFKSWRNNPALLVANVAGTAVLLFAFVTMAFYGSIPGGDGNYYVFPIVAVTATGIAVLGVRKQGLRQIVWMLLPLLAFNTYVWFATSPEWTGGMPEQGFSLLHTPAEDYATREWELSHAGVGKIAGTLAAASKNGHCTAVGSGFEGDLFLLPCAVEEVRFLSFEEAGHGNNAEALSSFIVQAHYDFIVRARNGVESPLAQVFDAYAHLPGAVVIDDVGYQVLDMRDIKAPLPIISAGAMLDRSGQRQNVDLVSNFAQATVTKVDEKTERWRQSVEVADRKLDKYLEGDALVIRNGAAVSYPLSLLSTTCPATFSFRIGLQTFDRVWARKTDGLLVELVDTQSGTLLASDTVAVPPDGFARANVPLKKCTAKSETLLRLQALAVDAENPASIVVADPELTTDGRK